MAKRALREEIKSVHKIIESLRKPVLDIDSESNQPGNGKYNIYQNLGFEDVRREKDYLLRCKITDQQYQILESVRSKNAEKFKRLLGAGIDPGFVTEIGETPLHIVAGMKPEDAVLEILSMLVYFGTSLDNMDRFGQTPLHHASRTSAQNVKILLEGGANTDLMDNSGRTALMEVCNSCAADALTIVQYLMDRGCNIFCSDQEGCTALHYICMNKSQLPSIKKEITYKLLYAGLSCTATDKTGKMAVCYEFGHFLRQRIGLHSGNLVSEDRLMMIRTLIQAGSNYNHKNQRHQKFVKEALVLNNGPIFSQILQEFEPVLSVTAIKSLQQCIYSNEDHVQLSKDLSALSSKVHSLKFFCRISVRDILKGKCIPKIDLLPLPRTLKEYLLLGE